MSVLVTLKYTSAGQLPVEVSHILVFYWNTTPLQLSILFVAAYSTEYSATNVHQLYYRKKGSEGVL